MHPDVAVLFIALLVIGGLGALMARRRLLARVGLRNVLRRRGQAAVVVVGLLVATAILSGTFIIEDTFDAGIAQTVYDNLDAVDERVERLSEGGDPVPFPVAVFERLEENRSALPAVDGVAPRVHSFTAAEDLDTGFLETRANLVAFDAAHEVSAFLQEEGGTFDPAGLRDDEVLLEADLADSLGAGVGHRVNLTLPNYTGFPWVTEAHTFTVRGILANRGLGGWGSPFIPSTAFLTLEAYWARTGLDDPAHPLHRTITAIVVSNVGGVREGHLATDAAVRQVNESLLEVLGQTTLEPYEIDAMKRDLVEAAEDGADQLAEFFAITGTFTVISGVMLIMNIFVMLAEERKGEMGVARALGMRRSHLVQAFVFEGLAYALAASAVGSLAGLLVGGVVVYGAAQFFGSAGGGFPLTVRPESVLLGFALGFLVTMATIVAVSWRVSHLNIVRAIRDIPEPRKRRSRGELAAGVLSLSLGALWTALAFANESPELVVLGPCVLALGVALLAARRVNSRVLFSATGLFILFWVLKPFRFFAFAQAPIALFIVMGCFLILGGVLVVVANSRGLLRLLLAATRSRHRIPVVKAAVAYPMSKAFRTGTTMGMIALIIFTVTVVTQIQGLVSGTVDSLVARESGGYLLVGSAAFPMPEGTLAREVEESGLAGRLKAYDTLSTVRVTVRADGEEIAYFAHGVTQGFASNATFTLSAVRGDLTDAEAWALVAANGTYALVDGTVAPNPFGFGQGRLRVGVGDALNLTGPSGASRNVTVIGILHSYFNAGVYVSAGLAEDLGAGGESRVFLAPAPGEDRAEVKRAAEKALLGHAVALTDVRASVEESMRITLDFITLLEAFLALGLLVGIAGLGVITMRNVVERRGETGALRALGFRRRMVLEAIVLEVALVALLGILVGMITGTILSYNMWLDFMADQGPFLIAWLPLTAVAVLALGVSVLATLSPAVQAARLPPAEALRRVD